MIRIMSQSGHQAYGVKEYVLDTAVELKELPLDDKMGSVALVIETSDVYILNGEKEWVKL